MSVTVPLTFSPMKEAGLVEVAGSYNNWTKVAMTKNPETSGEWSIAVKIDPGTHQYKYIVDGEWVVDSECAIVDNNQGGINNLITVAGDLSNEDLQFLVKTIGKSEDEVQKYYKLFKLRHATGNIDKKEYKKECKKMATGIQDNLAAISFISNFMSTMAFSCYDTDQNGYISFREVAYAVYVNEPREWDRFEDKVRLAFRMCDLNHSGTFGRKDFFDFVCAISCKGEKLGIDALKVIEERAMRNFDKIDTNEDGIVFEDEFVESCGGWLYKDLCDYQESFLDVIKTDFTEFMKEIPENEFDDINIANPDNDSYYDAKEYIYHQCRTS